MNILPLQNNNQSFGMSFRLKAGGARRFEQFLDCFQKQYKDEFMRGVIEPIQKLPNQDVIFDGEKIFVRDHISGRVAEIADEVNGRLPYAEDFVKDGKSIQNGRLRPVILACNQFLAHIKENGIVSEIILNTPGKTAEEEIRAASGLSLKFNIAKRLAEHFDKISKS